MTLILRAYQAPEHQPFFWRGQSGCAALLVHGFPGTPAEMRPLGQVLHSLDWTVQGLLLPGFGPQFDQLTHYCQRDWQEAVQTTLTNLQREHTTVLLIGNSMGAALALQVAAVQSPSALLLFAPFWRSANRLLDAAFPVARRFLRQVRPFQKADFADSQFRAGVARVMPDADLDDPDIQTAIRQLELPIDILGEVRQAGRLGYQALPQVKTPVVIMQGSEDIVAIPRFTRQMARRLPMLAGYVQMPGRHELIQGRSEAWPLIAALVQQFAHQLQQPNETTVCA